MAKAKRAKRGKKPEMVVTSETLGAEIKDSFLPDDEPAAMKLSVARAPLDWQQQTDEDVEGSPAQLWVATRPDGTSYAVEEDVRDWRADPPDTSPAWFCQVDGEELGDPQPTLEAAQAVCQWHADTELTWEPDGACYRNEHGYHVDPIPDGGHAAWIGDELIDDTTDSSDEARDACQAHYREQHPPPQAEPAETPAPDGKPARELGDWMIGRPPTVEIRAELAMSLTETSEEMEALEIELAAKERAFKAERKRIEKEVADIRERQRDLASEVRHGMSAKVRCWRERLNGEWLYTDETGNELYREPAETLLRAGAQQKIVGDRTVPKEPPPATEPPPLDDERRALAEAWRQPPPDDPSPATEPEADHAPPALPVDELPPAGEPLQWSSCKGEHGTEYYCGGEREGYVVSRDPGTQSKAGKGGLLRIRYYNLALGIEREWGNCITVAEAKKEAQRDNDTRLRFPGDVARGLLLDSTGCYQLVRTSVAIGPGRGEGPKWRAERVGGQDEQSTDLGEHDELAGAVAACQADADQRRAEA